MTPLRLQSAAEQVAAHLRQEVSAGVRRGILPGVTRLAGELGVNHKTVEVALRLLEHEGVLVGRGARRGRLIDPSGIGVVSPGLRVGLLEMDTSGAGENLMIDLRHQLEEAGHLPFYPEKTLLDLGMDARRVARFVAKTEADAWVIGAGSRDVLSWFAEQEIPAFALFGGREGVAMAGAGPDKSLPTVTATRHLVELGHARMTFLIRRLHRVPEPAPSVRAYLGELESHGVRIGEFNLPDWEESRAGFQAVLESLFRITPPTAMIIDEAVLFSAAIQFFVRRGIRVPEDVSVICTDNNPTFAWCVPSVAHIRWDYGPVVRRIVRWAAKVSRGEADVRQTLTRAEFVDGGTVGKMLKS